jgi:hypothetical protein
MNQLLLLLFFIFFSATIYSLLLNNDPKVAKVKEGTLIPNKFTTNNEGYSKILKILSFYLLYINLFARLLNI